MRRPLFGLALALAATVTALGCGAILDVSDPEIVPFPLEAGSDAHAGDAAPNGVQASDGSTADVADAHDGHDADDARDAAADAPAATTCVIDSVLYPAGTASPSNPCQSCQPSVSTSLWSNSPDGTSCETGPPPKICHAGVCTIGCFIDGAFRQGGTDDPANSCQLCAPGVSTTSWTAVGEGSTGACGAGQVCHAGSCAAGCGIGGFQLPDALNANDPCQQCVPAKSTQTWTNVADGAPCGSGQTCAGGQCGTQCVIGGSTYAAGVHDSANPCRLCLPGTSASQWSSVTCSPGQVCDPGSGNCVCNATSCPNGCCSGATCQAYASQSGGSCGTGGAACTPCAYGLCDKSNGTCACNAATCAGGCCNGGTGGACVALASESAQVCGKAGAACGVCSGGTPACVQGACAACDPGTTQCSGGQIQTCTAAGTWGAATSCPANQTCEGTSCKVQCIKTVTTQLNVVNPYSSSLLITYDMVGGGGGVTSAGAGGGGGSSAIVVNTTLQDFAAGGRGGGTAGENGQSTLGTFSLAVSSTLHVYVGGGGGAGSANAGGGGGSGYYGGGGGGSTGGGGGSNTGGAAGGSCPAGTAGSSQHGGDACILPDGGRGGAGANGGAAGTNNGAGGGGGFGAGGGGGNTNGTGGNNGTGGSSGGDGGSSNTKGGLGANNWASATTLPAAAGEGGSFAGTHGGGNGGLVILKYTTTTGTCSL